MLILKKGKLQFFSLFICPVSPPPPSLPSFLVPKVAARPELAAGKISLGWPSFFQGF